MAPTTNLAPPLLTPVATQRIANALESERIGSVPQPRTLKGVAKSALSMLKGQRATILIDKLGQRAAFERAGTRLYDALLSKYDAYGGFPGGPMRADLELIRSEELAHFHLVVEAIELMGGDPTAVTPGADRDGVMSMGLVQILTDPRTTLPECLEAVAVAELVDNDCWLTLIEVCETLGQDKLVTAFSAALDDEARHLTKVRSWLKAYVKEQAEPARPD